MSTRPLRGRVVPFLAGAMLVLLAGCRNESASAPQDVAPAASAPSEPGVQAAGERVMPESGAPPPVTPEPGTPPVTPEPGTPPVTPEPGTPPVTPEPTGVASGPSTDAAGKMPGSGTTPVVPPPRSSDLQVTTTLPPEPAPERDPRDDVEAFYAGLPEEAIAFHVPATVPRGQLFTVRLVVEPGKSEAEIARVLVEMARDAGPGEVRTRTARVGDEMQALLSSPTLQIITHGNDTQLVRRSGVTEWAWDVTATTGGLTGTSTAW